MSACDDVRLALTLGSTLDRTLAAHLAGCDVCRVAAPAARALSAALAADATPLPPPGLSARVLRAAAVPLAAHARRVARPDWWTVGRAVAVALLPLPLVVWFDALLVRGAYRVLTLVLPDALGLYLVGSYAVVLALLLSLTYAAVPLLAARQTPGGAHV